jgi:hypothetical protein
MNGQRLGEGQKQGTAVEVRRWGSLGGLCFGKGMVVKGMDSDGSPESAHRRDLMLN